MGALFSRFCLFPFLLSGVTIAATVNAYAVAASVAAGRAVNLTATADGLAPFTYAWYKDGSLLNGETTATYAITSFQGANAGTYHVVISNLLGSTTTETAVLTLNGAATAPAFTTQPASQTVTAGGAVTFTAWRAARPRRPTNGRKTV